MATARAFVDKLVLDDCSSKLLLPRGGENYDGHHYTNDGSLMSFTEHLSPQNKEDVLNSTLLAQLAANKKHDRYTELDEWYKFYINVLENIGWTIQEFEFQKYDSKIKSLSLAEVVLEILEMTTPELLKGIQETIQKLKETSNGEALKLFESRSSSHDKANFQIVPFTEGRGGQVTGKFIGLKFNSQENKGDYFFFTWNSSSVEISYCHSTVTLNEKIYSKVRDNVENKLGDKAKKFIQDLDI